MGVWDEVLTVRPARVADGDTHWPTPVSWRFDGPRANGAGTNGAGANGGGANGGRANGGGVRCGFQPMPGTEPM